MSPSQRISKLAGVISVVGIAAMPLHWVPLLVAGGIVLEVPNVVSALFAVVLPLAILMSKRMWRINLLFGLLIVWALLFLGSMVIHKTPEGIALLRQYIVQVAFGWTLALSIAHSNIRISKIGLWALICLVALLFISAALARVNLLPEVLNFILGGDRNRFMYRTMRPIFNAFVFSESDLSYVSTLVNNLANSLVLFSILPFLNDRGVSVNILTPAKLLSLACIVFAFLIFSTSANIVIFVFMVGLALHTLAKSQMFAKVALPLLFVAAAIVAFEPTSEYISRNLMDDTGSRDSRLNQYSYAINVISDNVILGVGYFEYGVLPVHNWPLFSWSTSGYFAFFVVIAFYLLFSLFGFRLVLDQRENAFVMIPLIAMVFVRTSVGGGGGIPSGSAMVAIAVTMGLVDRHWRIARSQDEMTLFDRGNIQPRTLHTGYPTSA